MGDKILVAVDLNDPTEAERVAARGAKLAAMEGAELHLLNVVPDSGMSIVDSYLGPKQAEQILEGAKQALTDFGAKALPKGVVPQLHVARGAIYDQILKTAQDLDVSIIVVGAHRPEFRDYLIGPNAARVARHTDRSVFIVR